MKVLISKKTGNYYYWKNIGDLHTKEGFITQEDLTSGKSIVLSNIKREFFVFNSNNYDNTSKIKRGPQLITNKDLGYILARTRIGKNSFVVEAGSGSGAATVFFAQICSKVHSYDIKEENISLVQKNLDSLEIKNVKLITKDLAEEIDNEKSIDMLFLDLPDPAKILEKKLNSVKNGHYIVCYVPSIMQIQEIISVVKNREDYYLEEISEVILRHWRVWDRVARPEHRKEIDHTAFLVFVRRI